MARGLSTIQKKILSRVMRKGGFASSQYLLTELWGILPGAVVDKSKYAAAHVTLSRSLTRLWLRGLIQLWQHKVSHYRTGITLTEAGEAIAKSIFIEENKSG